MKNLIYLYFFALVFWVCSCQKDNQKAYKSFLGNSEIIYTGAVSDVIVQPGNLSVGLKWKASSDPSITRYVIYYNAKKDSAVVPVTGNPDSIRTVIRNLTEYAYNFTIYSYDKAGNKSIPTEVNNAKVYGPNYISTLSNRGYDGANPYVFENDGRLTLNFVTPDTININTVIKYTKADGQAAEAILLPNINSITLPSYKPSTAITYRSSYVPSRNAIDVFTVPNADSFPSILFDVQCDKSLFKALFLTNDMPSDYGDGMEHLWDGSVGPQAHPNIFHTAERSLPHSFTFDMGKTYSHLSSAEVTGRNSDHNPAAFEIWGINDIQNAATVSDATSESWRAEMLAKGWLLLGECNRTDDGKQSFKFNLNNGNPPVRYIRIRVTKTVDNSKASNWGELTFWNKQ